MDDHAFQAVLLGFNSLIALCGWLAWYSIGNKIDAVKELHAQRFQENERRIELVEDKCREWR